MNVNELQLDDFVGVEYYTTGIAINGVIKAEKKIMPCKVIRIEDYIVTLDRPDGKIKDAPVSDLIPIPLTKEMLETNGWKSKHHTSWLFFREGCDELNILLGNGSTEIEYLNMIYNPEDNAEVNYGSHLEFPRIIFVHELQHIIRMFEIEKEIKL